MITNNWLLLLILTPMAVCVLSVCFFLWGYRSKNVSKCKSGVSRGMLVWTNQSALQHQPEPQLSPEEAWMLRMFGPWLDGLPNFNGCTSWTSGSPYTPVGIGYSLMVESTNNWCSSNLLGEGPFGHVYLAKLDHGEYAAVKRITNEGKQGEADLQEEVDLMRRAKHRNLVLLLGFSTDGPERLLVYEFMQKNLHDQLHGPSHGSALTWNLRLKIALEAARGLEHLHEHCKPVVIYRDFKSSNILLYNSYRAKMMVPSIHFPWVRYNVNPFTRGSALPVEEGRSLKDSVQVQGTFGHVAPECFMYGIMTEKGDVYGFGVVLLELLTGRLPIDESMPLESQSLVTWATPLLSDRTKVLDIIAPCLRDTVNVKHLYQVAAVAALCVQTEPSYRPLITDVVQSLLPLVPQDLGGALRDPKSLPSAENYTSVEVTDDSSDKDPDQQSFSKRSDLSFSSLEEPFKKFQV